MGSCPSRLGLGGSILFVALLMGTSETFGGSVNTTALAISWLEEIPANGASDNSGTPLTVMDFARTPTGGLALYGKNGSSINKVQVFRQSSFEFLSVNPSGAVHYIAASTDGGFYLAGSVQKSHGWPVSFEKSPSDAYLAFFSSSGDLVWEKTWGDTGFQVATDVAALPDGGAVVSVLDGSATTLWAVDAAGETLWQESVGAKGAAVTVLTSGPTIAVATMDNAGRDRRDPEYSETLVLSLRDMLGQELSRTVMRPDLNRVASGFYLEVTAEANTETVITASSWAYFRRDAEEFKPVEIAAYDRFGTLKWRHQPSTIDCKAFPSILSDGSVLVVCAEAFDGGPRHLVITRYSPTGEVSELRSLLPECQQTPYPVVIHPVWLAQDRLTMLASRPAFNSSAGCSWVATIDMADL